MSIEEVPDQQQTTSAVATVENTVIDEPPAASKTIDPFVVADALQSLSTVKPTAFESIIRDVDPAERRPIAVAACPVCECVSAMPTYRVEASPYSVVTCRQCGLGRLNPQPKPDEIATFYPPEYYGDSGEKFVSTVELAVRTVARQQAARLTRGLPVGSRVLDVGCGRGTLLTAFADRGFEAHGFEISSTAAEGADPRTRIHVAQSLIAAELPSDHFDQVTLWHVLEHLPNPQEVLQEVRRILKPGGRIAVAVPNFSSWQARCTGRSWFHLDLPRHLFHFPAATLRRLMEDCGFRIKQARHFSLRQNPYGWVQSVLNHFSPRSPNRLYSLLKRRSQDVTPTASSRADWLQRLGFWVGLPVGVLIACVAAVFRNGATVCLTGECEPNLKRSTQSDDVRQKNGLDEFAARHPECFPVEDATAELDGALLKS